MAKFESMEFNIFELVLINLDEFADLCNAIALRFQKEDVPSCFENLPSIYHSPFSEKLKAFIRSTKFGYMISIILIVNLVAVIVETTLDIQESSLQSVWQEVEFVFGWIYVLEMALKIYSYGFENYWRDGQNRFDFLVTWVIVVSFLLTQEYMKYEHNIGNIASHGPKKSLFYRGIRYLLLARMLRLIRLLMHVQQYRGFVATFLTLIPSLMPYLGTIFCVQCIYCSLGVQIFGGIVNAGNAKLEETDLADDEYPYCYLLFNFNDYPNGMVTLFNLLVMGNWQVWMQVIAFVLEAFFAEMELESSEKCEEEDKDGEPRERRRRVGTKTRSQKVDVLLHHMLSAELQKSCDS
ncbi:Two pore calcium channel protein 1 [Citrus sinensis]|uniref:Two pore calcium channel protein 1 n=1 Tax=Citrus sinensis TaxID=2711 RepID=A0ACB8N3M6_CITSI|nr:Two pore calcium channel protein 1 [Citrus sinensis]